MQEDEDEEEEEEACEDGNSEDGSLEGGGSDDAGPLIFAYDLNAARYREGAKQIPEEKASCGCGWSRVNVFLLVWRVMQSYGMSRHASPTVLTL